MGWEKPETIIRALRILEALGGTGAVEAFGRRFFHDSPNWRRAPGKQIKASAGLLGRLRARGLVVKVTRGIYRLSDEGRRYLASRGLPPPPPPPAPSPQPGALPAGWYAAPQGGMAPGVPGGWSWCPPPSAPAPTVQPPPFWPWPWWPRPR